MNVILSASSKGGVGKTQIAELTAEQLNRDGFDVAVMDADIDSSNLSSRMEAEGRVEHTDDDKIKPIQKNGMLVYSMESAFNDSSFSQSGEFMRVVIRNMVEATEWGNPDYLVVDCPPGTKDIFDEVVKVFRDQMLGAIVVGQSDTIDDVGRMIKVCNHNYVPIIGLIENMSGVWSEGQLIKSPNSSTTVAPFGRGNVKALSEKIDGRFLGSIPLCENVEDIEDAAANTVRAISVAVQDSNKVDMPSMNEGDKGFIRNVLGSLKAAIKAVNKEFNVDELQEEYGTPDNPKTIQIELTDASGVMGLPSKIHLKVQNGVRVIRNPDNVFGGIKISSQELKFALQMERMVMDSPKALYSNDYMSTTSYGLVDAVQMGKADVWGDDVINYLSLLDKIFTKAIDETKLQKAMKDNF